MIWVLLGVGSAAILLTIGFWAACVIARKSDEDYQRYLDNWERERD